MSSVAASSAPGNCRSVTWGRVTLVGLATVAAAVLANLVVYAIGGLVVGYDPTFLVLATAGGTIIFTIACAIVAVLVYGLILRFTADPARVFTRVAAVVLVLSVIPDLTYIPSVPGASGAQAAVLVLMHVVAAVVIVRVMTMLTRPSPR
ncbi:MAG: hypothetical protein IT337_01870 [Thermomicrobiales bacterium]|nr:hypothetical protein [Thermomicrobiales bacterium]